MEEEEEGAVLSFPTDYKARMLFNWTVARELRKKNEISEPRFWLKHFTISTFTHSHLIVKEQRAISCNEILKKNNSFLTLNDVVCYRARNGKKKSYVPFINYCFLGHQ